MLHSLRRILLRHDPLLEAIQRGDIVLARLIMRSQLLTVIGAPRYYGDTADCIPNGELASQIAMDAESMDNNNAINPYSISHGEELCVVAFTNDRHFVRFQRRLTFESDQVTAIPKYGITGEALLSLIDQRSSIVFNPGSSDQMTVHHGTFANPNAG